MYSSTTHVNRLPESNAYHLLAALWPSEFSSFLLPPPSFPPFIVFVPRRQHAVGPALRLKTKAQIILGGLTSLRLLLWKHFFPTLTPWRSQTVSDASNAVIYNTRPIGGENTHTHTKQAHASVLSPRSLHGNKEIGRHSRLVRDDLMVFRPPLFIFTCTHTYTESIGL